MARKRKEFDSFNVQEFMEGSAFSGGTDSKPLTVKMSKSKGKGKAGGGQQGGESADPVAATAQSLRRAAQARIKYAKLQLLKKKKKKKRKGRRIKVK